MKDMFLVGLTCCVLIE
uniref:Uncharacterized protein n=1 Tax=Anopheles quadriannulatus TaxID=34691 RepID=A0A182XU23_ANOQN